MFSMLIILFQKKRKQIILIWIFLINSLMYASTSAHPALQIQSKFELLQQDNYVSPYIVTIYALELLKHKDEVENVKAFIWWYINHINKSDRYDISGTIYDYSITQKGEEHSLKNYDSADGYAGLFLYLVGQYYELTKDKTFLKTIFPMLKDTIYLIFHLQDKDGLTIALSKSSSKTKYLMDNVESFLGTQAYIDLSQKFGTEDDKRYLGLKETLKQAIFTQLYDPVKRQFYWAKEGKKVFVPSEKIFYPDMFSQIHLLAFFGKYLDRKTSIKLWQRILKFYKKEPPCLSMEQLLIFERARTFALKHQL